MNRFWTFSPFKAGLLVVFAAALLYLSFDDRKPALLAALDNRGVDSMFQLRGARPTGAAVVIIDIDEKSLHALGQWPWPRDQVARLVDAVGAAGARVVGFDVVFAETDRTSPQRLVERLGSQLTPAAREGLAELAAVDHDQLLGEAVARLPAVLGYVFLLKDDGLKNDLDRPFPSATIRTLPEQVPFAQLGLIDTYRPILNVPAVAQAETEGFFNFFPDASGMVRKVPLFLLYDGLPYPALALEMVRLGQGRSETLIHAAPEVGAGRGGVLGVSLGETFYATDDSGQMTVNYRGPVGSFPYVSAIDVLNGEAAEQLRDRYVLLGTTAAGLHDLRATPFSSVFPGVEIHATIIDNLLAGDPLIHDPLAERGVTFVLILAGGIILSALLAFGTPLIGAFAGLLLAVATLVGNYQLFFLDNVVVGVAYPLLTLVVVFLVVSVSNHFYVGREKRFIDMAFSRYVSPQVVQQLKKNPAQLTLSGEDRELTILFSDIRGFTTLAEQIPAARLGTFMNRYLTAMGRVVMTHRGTVDKFIGDAIMALWGAPLADPDHAANGVRTALAMIERLASLQADWRAEGVPQVEIGIGINTGLVSVGNFGSEERFDYTVLGDNVNLAARLEGLTKLYGVAVIISGQTLAELKGRFSCRLLDEVRVKGKRNSVRIYEPLCEGPLAPPLQREVDRFHAAREDYVRRDFAAAEEAFEALYAARPHPLYALYRERLAVFRTSPPPDDWDGIFTLQSK